MIFIDYFSTFGIVNEIAKYTGGTNYSNNVICMLKEKNAEAITIIVPDRINNQMIPQFIRDNIEIIKTNCLQAVDYTGVRLLFLPQVNGTVLRQLNEIKKKYPNLLIYGTLHDRQHNCFLYDNYNNYYYEGVLNKAKNWVQFYAKKFYFDISYSNWIGTLDKVFTVSNYSLQKLRNKKVNSITYFVQDDYTSQIMVESSNTNRELYCLMVGAGRPEKNALRTLEAFCRFHNNKESSLKLILTGVDNDLLKLFLKSGKLDERIIKEFVEVKGYVSYEELNDLYQNSAFIVFTSKAEGFGLPVLEAIKRNKAVLSSFATSIPEVAGSAALYVNPYDVESINKGFQKLAQDDVRKRYESYIRGKKKIIEEQIAMDNKIFIDEIFDVSKQYSEENDFEDTINK